MNRIILGGAVFLILVLGFSPSSQGEEKGLIRVSRSESSSPPKLYFPSDNFLPPQFSPAGIETLTCPDGDSTFGVGANGIIGFMEAMQFSTSDSCSLAALLFWPSDPDSESPDLHWMIWADSSGLPGALLDSGTVSPFYDNWYRINLPDTEKIFLSTGAVFYIGWADVDSPFFWNVYDDTSGTMNCTYYFDGFQWQFDTFFGGDFLLRGICETFDSLIVGVEEKESANPESSSGAILLQNQPNPFHSTTLIRYVLPAVSSQLRVRLEVFDLTGRMVDILVDEPQEPGVYQIQWEGKDPASQRSLPTGIYFYRLKYGDFITTRKMTLLR
ncbi:T9SS type A sorting domain-containing protein [candidate division TA06 bacterium]|nr:T9SS type A sorting domain-containing protein [candidate division TA06 bacterium]